MSTRINHLLQAYCAVVKTNAKYDGKFVNIEQVKTKEGALGVDAEHANRHVVYRVSERVR